MTPDGFQIIAFLLALFLAITFHEAAHGFVARLFGDYTATRLGRVTLNPLKHIDPFGTIILPGFMLLSGTPFLFGYAKPVPVNLDYLRPQRWGMVFVAAAGPGMNLLLAWISAVLLHLTYNVDSLGTAVLLKSIQINIVLAIFNMFPIPPLDGGKVAVGLLPRPLSRVISGLEPYGIFILLALIILPGLVLRPLLGINVAPLQYVLVPIYNFLEPLVMFLSGH